MQLSPIHLYALASLLINDVHTKPIVASLPVIDLGYTRYKASDFNSTGNFYTFSNIAYAQPPIGPLRWKAPRAPPRNNSIQDPGSAPRECPQSAQQWINEQTNGGAEDPIRPSESEDCLYLDVFVPKPILERASTAKPCAEAPVLVWIHGGGYTLGSKSFLGSPSGMLAQKMARDQGMIFAAMNYRLGAFGFLNGPVYNEENGGANVGLLDQRAALLWIQDNVGRFGGDKNRITLMGESGGALAIALQLAADPAKFGRLSVQRVIPQSVAGYPVLLDADQDNMYQGWKDYLNVRSLNEARGLDTKTLQLANRAITLRAPYGFSPFMFETKKGGFVENSIAQSILRSVVKRFPKIDVMVGTNNHEGKIFADPAPNATFPALVQTWFPHIPDSSRVRIVDLYGPAGLNTAYTNELERHQQFVGDVLFNCNGYAFQKAYASRTDRRSSSYGYRFSVPPALHIQDLWYTWFSGDTSLFDDPAKDVAVAQKMQAYFTNFAVTGKPDGGNAGTGLPEWEMYGQGRNLNLTRQGFEMVTDESKDERCEFLVQF